MKIAVTGEDKRLICLSELLRERGHALVPREEAELEISRWPSGEERLLGVPLATCGPAYAPEDALDLLRDEAYQTEIAMQTAEGAVCAAMRETEFALQGAACLVIGWGRIGKALTRILAGIGAETAVSTRHAQNYGEIRARGAHPETLPNALAGKRAIFSTAPAPVLTAGALRSATPGTIVIDLASPPYGVDLEAAARLGLRAWREPGLPGRYCPQSAARAILNGLLRGGALHE